MLRLWVAVVASCEYTRAQLARGKQAESEGCTRHRCGTKDAALVRVVRNTALARDFSRIGIVRNCWCIVARMTTNMYREYNTGMCAAWSHKSLDELVHHTHQHKMQ